MARKQVAAKEDTHMNIRHPEIGICGLSCRLCPRFHTIGISKCGGCKSEYMMAVGCPFITCAVKRKGIEFCGSCEESKTCEKLRKQREFSRQYDTFTCYQKLEDNISFIQNNGVNEFEERQKTKEELLKEMLRDFNEGRSKTFYCIAATVLKTEELEAALRRAREFSKLDVKEKSRILHSILYELAEKKHYLLKLRKYWQNKEVT